MQARNSILRGIWRNFFYAYHNCALVILSLAGKRNITLVLQWVLVKNERKFPCVWVVYIFKIVSRIKSSPVTSQEDSEDEWEVTLPSSLWNSAKVGRQRCQLSAPAALHHQINPLVLVLEVVWSLQVLNADRRNTSLENFQVTYRESNPEPPVLWHSSRPLYPILKPFISQKYNNLFWK